MAIVSVYSEIGIRNSSKCATAFPLASVEALTESSVGHVLETGHTDEMKDFILLM